MKILHSHIAGFRPVLSLVSERFAWALACLSAALVLIHPCEGRDGLWTFTGSLVAGRANHAATVLANGKVLVAGGFDPNFGYVSSAELYDPAIGIWTATGSLAIERTCIATLLPTGNVLVAGGYNYTGYFAIAELYDPESGTWTETSSLANARADHTATLLPSGKVLVAGGVPAYTSAELYDPGSGMWTATGDLRTGRWGHTATLLPNGKVLVAGGADSQANRLMSAELYDPESGTWTGTGSLGNARGLHTATLLSNGKVLVASGDYPNYASAELYDPASGTWAATGSLVAGRFLTKAALLANGKVLIEGGLNDFGAPSSDAQIYDPVSETWTAAPNLLTNCAGHSATSLPGGQVLVAGGARRGSIPFASAELYTPSTVNELCLEPPAGLVSWWSGDKTADDVQGANNGVLLNGASFTTGMVGPAFSFDGIDDGVGMTTLSSFSHAGLTVDAWIYQTGNQNTNRRIIGKDDGSHREYSVGIIVPNTVQGFVNVPSFSAVTGTTTIQLNSWYHIAMTHDGLKLRLYVNGIQEGEVDAVGDIVPTSAPGVIGSDLGLAEPFKGRIDEAQIFNRALSNDEILSIYQAGVEGQCKPEIFVSSIDSSYTAAHSRYLITISLAIQDSIGVGISGADANLQVRFPSGSELVFQAKPHKSGETSISFYSSETGTYRLKVLRVSHPTRTYDASLNIETNDTLLIP